MLAEEPNVPAYTARTAPTSFPSGIADRMIRWDVHTYRGIAEAGLLPADVRTELVEGQIVLMSPAGALHIGYHAFLQRRLGNLLREDEYFMTGQSPLLLDDYNEPEPDAYVLPYRADHYTTLKPTATDALLVCEVAVSTLGEDLGPKARHYARFGIPEYWVIAPAERELHYHDGPNAAGYRRTLTLAAEEAFASRLLGATTPAAWMPPVGGSARAESTGS